MDFERELFRSLLVGLPEGEQVDLVRTMKRVRDEQLRHKRHQAASAAPLARPPGHE